MSILDFWKLVVESRLLSPPECKKLAEAFGADKASAAQQGADKLADWLVSKRAISRYQAKILLAGRAGPFVYGNYKVYDRLSSGRLSGLFKAVHTPTGHPVCLQFVTGAAAQAQTWPIAAAQIHNACHADDSHLSRCFELVDLGSYKFAVVEDLAGDTIEARLAKGRLPPDEACRLARDAALGLQKLHELGLAHADVRPSNLWADKSGNATLLQVPLARDPATVPGPYNWGAQDPSGRLQASADYLAPELAHPGRAPDAFTDIYALGCTVYHMLTGRPPFAGGDIGQKMHRHAAEPIQPLEPMGVPQQLAQVVAYMMAKDPSLRYRQAAVVAEAMAYFVPTGSERPAAIPPTRQAYEQWLRQNVTRPPVTQPLIPASRPVHAGEHAPAQPIQHSAFAALEEVSAPAPRVASRQPGRPTSRRRSNLNAIVGIGSVLMLLIVAGLVYAIVSGGYFSEPVEEDPEPGTEVAVTDVTPEQPGAADQDGAAGDAAGASAIAESDRLWASPTEGKPLDLRYIAPGTQAIFAFRPADLLSNPDSEKLVDALGPQGTAGRAALEAAVGVPLSTVERVVIGVHERETSGFGNALVVYLAEKVPLTLLLQGWDGPAESKHGATTFYQGAKYSYFLPAGENNRVVVIGDPVDVKSVIDLKGKAVPLRQHSARLLKYTDDQQHVTMLFAPSFLFSDAQFLFPGNLDVLRSAGEWFLGDGVQAVALSFHQGDYFYAELRVSGTLDRAPLALAKQYQEQMTKLSSYVEDYLSGLNPGPYAQRFLLFRFPQTINYLAAATRSGSEGDHAVVNCSLPTGAGQYLLLGIELAVNQGGGGGAPAAAVAKVAPAKTEKETVAGLLKKPISLSFTRDTLEKSMEMISQELGVPVEIIGTDLQLDGITKNQSFGLDERDKPAGEILRTIMLKANPEGKLVYVIKPKEAGGEDMIFITTRAAVAKRGDKLPPELEKK